MTVFLDSSALVKLYADEEGSEALRDVVDPVVVSHVARVEVPAALWRKQRIGELDAGDAALLTEAFEADLFGDEEEPPRFAAVRLGTLVLDDAAGLTAVHGLRAYDAIQLASARVARRALGDCDRFAAYDNALRTAAAACGFTLLP